MKLFFCADLNKRALKKLCAEMRKNSFSVDSGIFCHLYKGNTLERLLIKIILSRSRNNVFIARGPNMRCGIPQLDEPTDNRRLSEKDKNLNQPINFDVEEDYDFEKNNELFKIQVSFLFFLEVESLLRTKFLCFHVVFTFTKFHSFFAIMCYV